MTGANKLLFMTKDFDAMTEMSLSACSNPEEQSVNVGWGKAENQFRGSAGKLRAEAAPVTGYWTINFGLILEYFVAAVARDDGKPRVSWRGDGELFVVSSLDQYSNIRVLRVFNRTGGLQSTSENINGLEHSLSWRPSGNWIARFFQRFLWVSLTFD